MSRPSPTFAALLALAVAACDGESTSSTPPPKPLEGELSLELRDTATVTLERTGGDAIAVRLTASAGYDLLPAGEVLAGAGFAEALAEASATLYTAKLAAPPQAGGPCAGEPVSLALSLHRPGDSATVVGGISAYCGADVWYGVPVRVLRLSGELR
jgi:hypothetical protein